MKWTFFLCIMSLLVCCKSYITSYKGKYANYHQEYFSGMGYVVVFGKGTKYRIPLTSSIDNETNRRIEKFIRIDSQQQKYIGITDTITDIPNIEDVTTEGFYYNVLTPYQIRIIDSIEMNIFNEFETFVADENIEIKSKYLVSNIKYWILLK